jgi:hypothetical protein
VALNLGRGKGWDHPLHMHGHHFWVLKVGYATYNETGGIRGDNMDIDCGGDPDRSDTSEYIVLLLSSKIIIDSSSFARSKLFASGVNHVNTRPTLVFLHIL